jgi:hypothetical protein
MVGDLVLTDKLFENFLGGLLAVCRVDGLVNRVELDALSAIGAELRPGSEIDVESLLLTDVTPDSLAASVAGGSNAPYRAEVSSPPEAVAQAFLDAAMRIASIDGDVGENETQIIRRFARALGVGSPT